MNYTLRPEEAMATEINLQHNLSSNLLPGQKLAKGGGIVKLDLTLTFALEAGHH